MTSSSPPIWKSPPVSVHVNDIVVLVIDPKDIHFGKVGKLIEHDLTDQGVFYVSFPGSEVIQYADGFCKGDPPSPVRIFYRHADSNGRYCDSERDTGPESFKKAFLSLNIGGLEVLAESYRCSFGEELA